MADLNRGLPHHFVLEDGRLIAKSWTCPVYQAPRTIDYIHTIRILPSATCYHEEQMARMRSEAKQRIFTKEEQLRELLLQLAERQAEIDKLKLKEQQKRKQIQSRDPSRMSGMNNAMKVSMLQRDDTPSQLSPVDNGLDQLEIVQREMRNTEQSLKTLSKTMGATKKKRYEFYYRQEPSSGEEKRNVLEATRLDTGRDPCQGNPELDSSFSDNTADNDSVDTREFLEEVISDHAHLKDVIQELQVRAKKEMEDLKNYYESAIGNCLEELQTEKMRQGTCDSRRTRTLSSQQDESDQNNFKLCESKVMSGLSRVDLQ